MSKRANPTLIGIFLFAGVILAIGGILLFTSSKVFTRTGKFIVYFDNTLNGLNEGAPVKYRGVTVGSVTRVMIRYNQATNDPAMPVIFEVEEDLVKKRLEGYTVFRDIKNLGEEIRKGLRASLQTESFVTGVLFIELENEASPPPAVYHQLKPVYVEIPSQPTEIQQLLKNLTKLDLSGLQQQLSALVTNADKLLASIRMDEIVGGLTNVLGSANRVVNSPDLTNAFTSFRAALDKFQLLATNLNNRVDLLAGSLTNALEELNGTLVQARGGLQNFRDTLAADSALRSQLNVALDQITQAAQSISEFVDYLHKHPNALLNGRRPVSENKP
jgi:paraquat-inducible protein B